MSVVIIQGEIDKPIVNVSMVVTTPASNTTTLVPKVDTPVLAGRIPGVALTTINPVTGLTSICTNCFANLEVEGKDSSGSAGADANVAVAVGDLIYMGADGVLSKRAGGTPFGTAFGNKLSDVVGAPDTRTGTVVASGQKATIRVWVGKIN